MNDVVVWIVDHSRLTDEVRARLLAEASHPEKERFTQFPRVERADAFLIGRQSIRAQLRAEWDIDEISIGCRRGTGPMLDRSTGIAASISHARGVTVVATARCRVGVDVTRRGSCPARLERLFSCAERGWLETIDHERRELARDRMWAIKEACSKAEGTGLFPLSRLQVPVATRGRTAEVEWECAQVFQTHVFAVAAVSDRPLRVAVRRVGVEKAVRGVAERL